jgi:iron(III) transport system permease protein
MPAFGVAAALPHDPRAAAPPDRLRTRVLPEWTQVAWALAALWLLYLVAIPIGYMLVDAFTDDGLTLVNFQDFAAEPKLVRAMLNSFLVALGVAVLSVLVGAPLAFGVALTPMRGKVLIRATMVISLISPDFLLAMAYIALAGPNAGYFNRILRELLGLGDISGPLNIFTFWGLIFTALPHGVSFVFLTLVPALRNMDPALDEAARLQGASVWTALRDVTLPIMRPALLSGALLAFAGSLAMYGPPHMLRLNVLTISIRESLIRLDFKAASVASVVLIGMSLVALALYRRSTQQAERFRTVGGKSFAAREIEIGGVAHVLTVLGVVYALIALVVPYGGMLMISFLKSVGEGVNLSNLTLENYNAVVTNPAVREAAKLSILLAAASATLVVAMGFVIAVVLVRSRLHGRAILDYLSILPLAVPGTALAIALIVVYLNWPLNALGFYGSFGILFVAYLARFVTFGVRTSQSTLVQLSPELEEASRVAGAGGFKTMLTITAPIMRQSLIYTWILVFILALPELSASVILKGIHTQTLSTALLDIWNGNGGLAMACAFGMTMFGAVSLGLLAAVLIGRRSALLKGF